MDRRVASILASFGGAGCESLELPRCFALPVSPTISFQVAPDLHLPAPADSVPRVAPVHAPSGFAIVEFPGRPESSLLARRWTNFLSFPKNLGPSASPFDISPSHPGSSSPGSTSMHSRVAPCPHRRLVDDVSPAESNFASRLSPRMNLRFQSGHGICLSDSRRNLNLCPSTHPLFPAGKLPNRNRYLHLLPGSLCSSNQLQTHQLVRDNRTDRSVEASAKPLPILWISPGFVQLLNILGITASFDS